MVPSILRRGQSRYLSFWWDFCNVVRFPVVFSFSWFFFFFLIFFYLLMFDGIHLQYSQVFVNFLYSESSAFVLVWYFYSFRHMSFSTFHYLHRAFSMKNSIPISSLYILTACNSVSNSFSFCQTIWCRGWFLFLQFMNFDVVVDFFSCNLWSFYPPGHFLNISVSGIIIIKNRNGDSAYPWKITLWIFTSAFTACYLFHSPVFHGILDKLYGFARSLVHFETVYYPGLHIIYLFVVNPRNRYIFSSPFALLMDVLINVYKLSGSACSLAAFFSSGNSQRLNSEL